MAFWKNIGLPVVKADDEDEEELVDPQATLRVSTLIIVNETSNVTYLRMFIEGILPKQTPH